MPLTGDAEELERGRALERPVAPEGAGSAAESELNGDTFCSPSRDPAI
jgi:hypothetical protein